MKRWIFILQEWRKKEKIFGILLLKKTIKNGLNEIMLLRSIQSYYANFMNKDWSLTLIELNDN